MKRHEGVADVSAFIRAEILKYGQSNGPPFSPVTTGITNYAYSEDKDGFQVLCHGNRVQALYGLLVPQFGAPLLTKTNSSGLTFFVFSGIQVGLAANCGLETESNKEMTHLAVVKIVPQKQSQAP